MKSFDDFLKTLDPKELAAVSKKAAETAIEQFDNKIDINNIGSVIQNSSATFTIHLLSKYHEWLSQQLS